ncbi:MAG: hypothetical protein KAH22_10310 [Thiotrichaceae bacterium]|nr:hypothetical protein [Thiotrichaceae bacterium]
MTFHSMTKKTITLLIFVVTSIISTATYANSTQVKVKLDKQGKDIQKGIQLGQITIAEKNILNKEQLRISKTYKSMLSDNKINSTEKTQLFKMLHRSRLKIFDFRYNKDRSK